MLRVISLLISLSMVFPWLDSKRRAHMPLFCLHWIRYGTGPSRTYVLFPCTPRIQETGVWMTQGTRTAYGPCAEGTLIARTRRQ